MLGGTCTNAIGCKSFVYITQREAGPDYDDDDDVDVSANEVKSHAICKPGVLNKHTHEQARFPPLVICYFHSLKVGWVRLQGSHTDWGNIFELH